MTLSHKPSVAIVVPSFDRGGLEQVALNLYRGYRARGCECIVLVERNVAGYMLGRLDAPEHGIVLNGEEGLFLEVLAQHKVDVLHYHYSAFGLSEAKKLGIYTLYTLHNVYTWLDDAGFSHHAGQLSEADRIVAVSGFVRDYFCERSKTPLDRVDVIPNGIDLAWASSQQDLPALDCPDGRFVFALPASYFPVKHHPLAIRAAEILLNKRKDFQLVFLGNIGDEDYSSHVDALVAASSARSHITQIDCLAHDQMSAFYRELVDCVLLPTIQEGCSNVVLEALSFDKQMILTDVGNAREARRMSARVQVIDRAEDLDALTPERIEELSRNGDCRNLRALVDAMIAALSMRGGTADAATLAARRDGIGLDRMADGYFRLFETSAPLAAADAGHAWAIPAAKPSKTLETLA